MASIAARLAALVPARGARRAGAAFAGGRAPRRAECVSALASFALLAPVVSAQTSSDRVVWRAGRSSASAASCSPAGIAVCGEGAAARLRARGEGRRSGAAGSFGWAAATGGGGGGRGCAGAFPCASFSSSSSSSPPPPASAQRHGASAHAVASLAKHLLIDTLDLVRRFESAGVPRPEAEKLAQYVAAELCEHRERLAETFVTKSALDKALLSQDATIAAFRAEVSTSQQLHQAAFVRDADRLQAGLDSLKSEVRYEVDKLTASQRLDLNLEKSRIRDELQTLRDAATELEIKVDKEVNSLKALMEQSKNDTVKYILGVVLALLTAGLGAARLFL